MEPTGSKRSLRKSWNLHSYFTSIFFIDLWSFCQESHRSILNSFLIEKKSDFDRRKWFFPILCPCLWASSYRSCPSNRCSSYFYTLWYFFSISKQWFLSSIDFLWSSNPCSYFGQYLMFHLKFLNLTFKLCIFWLKILSQFGDFLFLL